MAEYKFETDEKTMREINAVEAKLGMTHEEFVSKAAEFVEARESAFRRHSTGEEK